MFLRHLIIGARFISSYLFTSLFQRISGIVATASEVHVLYKYNPWNKIKVQTYVVLRLNQNVQQRRIMAS
jgi:hypothetical protein